VRVRAISAGELKEELSARGLDTSGKKAELVSEMRRGLRHKLSCALRVDRAVPGGAQYAVYEDYDVKLSQHPLVDGANVNKYYFLQVLQKQGGTFATYFKFGLIGEKDYGDKLDGPFESAAEAIQSFEAKFHEKTRGKKDKSPKEAAWAAYKAGQFEKREGYYGVVETKVGVNVGVNETLGQLKPATLAQHGAALVARLEDEDAGVRRAVVQTLGQLELATLAQYGAALVARLEDEDAFVRRAVVQTLGQLEPATLAQYGAALVARLEDSDAFVRRAVVETLGQLEPATLAQHCDALVAMLEDSDADVRRAVVQTLGQLELATLAQHGKALVARLEDSHDFVRRAVVEMLGKLELATLAQHGAALVAMLEDQEWEVRQAVVETLGQLELATLAQHGAALVAGLEDEDEGVRRAVVETLGKLEPGTLAQHGVALVARLEDYDYFVRCAVVETLGKLEPGTLAQYGAALVAMLKDSDEFVRHAVVETLGKLEPGTLAQYGAALVAMLKDSDEFVRRAVVETLGKLEPGTLAQYGAALVAMLKDSDEGVRCAVVETLEKDEGVRCAVVETLEKLEPGTLAPHTPHTRPAHAKFLHYYPQSDGRDAERLEGNTSELKLIDGVELRSSSRSQGGPLRADMFSVELIQSDHPRYDPLATGALSKVVDIKVVSGDVTYPLLLRMRHHASAEQFGQLAFYRAETPDSEMQLVEGGCFWSDGYAEVEVTSFSVWKIALEAAKFAFAVWNTYIDHPVGVTAFAPEDLDLPLILKFVLHPQNDIPPNNNFEGFCKVGEDKDVPICRGKEVTIALKDFPELSVTFQPWKNKRQSEEMNGVVELRPSSSHKAVIKGIESNERDFYLPKLHSRSLRRRRPYRRPPAIR